MVARAFSDETEARIVDWYRAGVPVVEIAERVGRPQQTVHACLRRLKVPRRITRHPPCEWQSGDAERIRDRWFAGESQTEIAEDLGVTYHAVRVLMRQHGFRHPDHHAKARGERHGSWRGGRTVSGDGYVLVLVGDDPLARAMVKGSYVQESRLVMAHALGRPLTSRETVHHRNGDTMNNDPSNLQLRSGRHGRGAAFVCNDCGSHDVQAVDL